MRAEFSLCCVAIVIVLMIQKNHAIYFFLEDGQTQCFLEEVPKDTLVLGRFKVEDATIPLPNPIAGGAPGIQFSGRQRNRHRNMQNEQSMHQQQQQIQEEQKAREAGIGIRVVVNDPEGVQTLQRILGAEGRYAFTSQVGGEYKMCFQTNTSSAWFGAKRKLKFHLDIETGEEATDYEDIAKQEQLSALEVEVRKLNDRLKDIRSEQNYQRNREMEFRDTSEETNSRVVWWSIIQTAILLAAGLWQISHLKTFFKTKKLV